MKTVTITVQEYGQLKADSEKLKTLIGEIEKVQENPDLRVTAKEAL